MMIRFSPPCIVLTSLDLSGGRHTGLCTVQHLHDLLQLPLALTMLHHDCNASLPLNGTVVCSENMREHAYLEHEVDVDETEVF